MDTFTKERRSEIMSSIRSKNTNPEKQVRSIVYRLGYRYRLHVRHLPGTPDLVFAGMRKIILVHGCFWHRHRGCKKSSIPKTNTGFWREKLDRNRARDATTLRTLRQQGWKVLTIWQCQLADVERVERRIHEFLSEFGNR